MANFIKTTDTVESNNYPYGGLRTDAKFSLDFDPKKGFRTVFQTKNPKTKAWNKPKKSTYSPIMLISVDENNFFDYVSLDLYGKDGINKVAKFVHENFDKFTANQITYLYAILHDALRMDRYATCQWGGAKLEHIKEFYEPSLELIKEAIETGENRFDEIKIDVAAIESKKPENFSPFVVTELN